MRFATCMLKISWKGLLSDQSSQKICSVLQIGIFRMASEFFIRAWQGWSGPGGWWVYSEDPQWGSWGKIVNKNSILRISGAEFELIKVLFYSCKSQNFYGMILRSPWFWKGKFNILLLIVLGATTQMLITAYKLRGIFRTQSNICDGAFLWK